MTTTLRGVIVGINNYRDIHFRERRLLFARADAEEMAATLHQSNVLHIEPKSLKLLTNEEATQENVWRNLNDVFATGRNYDQDTIALFYFAGHGIKDAIEGDSIILGCHDVDYRNPNQGGVRLNDIYRLVQRTSAGCSIAIIDACFSGAVLDLTKVDHESPAQLARKAVELIRAGADKTIAIFTACSTDQPAREDLDVRHGVYTYELLRGLRDGEARDERGIVDVSGLATYLGRRFAQDYDWQGPRSVVLGGRPVVLAQSEPRAPGTIPTPHIHPRAVASLTSVDGRTKMPTKDATNKSMPLKSQQKRRLKTFILVGTITGVLLLCVLANLLLEPIQHFSLVSTFIVALFLPFGGFIIHRAFGSLRVIAQIFLLAGFTYQYFGWGATLTGSSPIHAALVFLAGLLWLFWLVFAAELIILGTVILLALMAPLEL